MSTPVRLAVIGTGMFGLMHLRAYKQLERAGRAVVVAAAYSGRDRARAEMRAREFGVRLYDDYHGSKRLWRFPDGHHIAIMEPPAKFWGEVLNFWRTNALTMSK